MKKYKIIKEFPGSSSLGTIFHIGGFAGDVSKYPEFFEEVIEKDYEIISYVAKDNLTNITTKRRGAHLHEEYWTIHKVKRLSDGEIFTVGDRITGYHEDVRSIQTIRICTHTGRVRLEQSGGYTDLSYATKAKQPIFLTHDGKDIFAGDKVWWVNKKTFCSDYFVPTPSVTFFSDINVYFLTEEAAEGYVYRNKVLFITEDGVGIKKGDTIYGINKAGTTFAISSTVVRNDNRICEVFEAIFSTRAAAENYVIQNSKILSIKDFWYFTSGNGSPNTIGKQLEKEVKDRLNLK